MAVRQSPEHEWRGLARAAGDHSPFADSRVLAQGPSQATEPLEPPRPAGREWPPRPWSIQFTSAQQRSMTSLTGDPHALHLNRATLSIILLQSTLVDSA